MIIAIDGPAASGKGTLARKLAARLDLAYLDTGSLYRAVGLSVIRSGNNPDDKAAAVEAAKALDLSVFTSEDLRSEMAGEAASKVAFISEVRAVLLDFQRHFARCPPGSKNGAVIDGRDIGTVVCPQADFKIFVTADIETRVARRVMELQARGETVIESRVQEKMEARDARDRDRGISPLTPAKGAWILNTTEHTVDNVLDRAMSYIAGKSVR